MILEGIGKSAPVLEAGRPLLPQKEGFIILLISCFNSRPISRGQSLLLALD